MSDKRPLVVGFGNALRGDDAIGWTIAQRLVDDARFADVDVRSLHQLTPELAEDFAGASRVVLIDAAADGEPPGTIHVNDVTPGSQVATMSHHVDARAVVALAGVLYGAMPPTFVVTVSLATTGPGHDLSPAVAAAIPCLVGTIVQLALEPVHA
jgi:hydrogenase maturation protease